MKLKHNYHVLTPYSITLDMQVAVKWLLTVYGFGVMSVKEKMATTSASVAGGELAWELTQISAGIKNLENLGMRGSIKDTLFSFSCAYCKG